MSSNNRDPADGPFDPGDVELDHEAIDQEWSNHLQEERDWLCSKHGFVSPSRRMHGGRARAFRCPKDGCGRTVKNTEVDWEAYHEARENDEHPPCPRCDSSEISTVPAKPKYRCEDCGHAFGQAAGYY